MLSGASRCSRRWPLHSRLPCTRATAQARSLLRPCAATTRGQATLVGLENHLKAGDDIHGFTIKRTKHVPELQLTAFDLQHGKTGAQYLHVARDDKNNVFSIGFKTNPPDATGVAHILEHTTLCGSQRYPVRDPFFKMLRRSLSNFMNAFTSSDHTSYPFATTNQQDFKNLLSVYLDATLHPLLRENDYTQEGWRIGPENPKAVLESPDPEADDQRLVFKGVVYNEMKGQMSDASYLYYIRFQEHIFPAIGNSGGDPQKMIGLSHQNLRDFHAKNYHPTNARLFTYGDMPLAEHASEISKRLDGFTQASVDTSIKKPIAIEDGPLHYVVKGPVDPMLDPSMQFKTSTSWILGDTSHVVETFSLGVLSSLLLNGYGSPLYQALIESGLGPDFSPNTGFDSSGRIGVFSVGLNGVKGDDVPKVKIALQQKLQEVHAQGFDKGKVDGILHQLELSLRHKTAGFGLDLMQRVEAPWFNGVDPFNILAWNDTVNAFKARYAAGGYLESLLQKYLLNDRTMTFTMEPSATYADNLKAMESSQLSHKISAFSEKAGSVEAAYENLTKKELELLDEQTKAPDQDLSSLPTLHVKDIPRRMERKEVRDSSLESASVQWREASTNGLTYFRAISPLEGLPKDLRMLIPLFTDAIMRLGTKDKTMEELEDLIKLKTGGVGVSYHSSPSPLDSSTSVEGFSFSGQALDGNINTVYELLRILVLETNFDGPEAENKILQLLQADSSGVLDAIASSGHSYARRYAEAAFSKQGLLNEQIGGLTQVQQTANLASRTPTEGLGDVLAKLKSIQKFALSKSSSFRAAITCGPEASGQNEKALSHFLSTLPEPISIPADVQSADDYTPTTFFPLPYQVSYAACSLPTVPYIDPAGAPLQILSQLLTHKHLHHEIREKGGAYGGGAYARGLSGIFGFYSYRDPNPQRTLEIIRDAGRWARDKDWTDQDLEEAKLSTFQSVDAPQSVSDEGMTRFLSGISEDMEQKQREHLLDVRKEDVQEVAQKYLVDGMQHARTAVLGEQKGWVKPSDGWTIKRIELSRPSETVGASDLSAGDLGDP